MLSLKFFREKSGFTQEQLSELSGISIHTIRAYEKNSRSLNRASSEVLSDLADILHVQLQALIEIPELSPIMSDLYDQLRSCSDDDLLNRNDTSGTILCDEIHIIYCHESYTWDNGNYDNRKRHVMYGISNRASKAKLGYDRIFVTTY